MDDDQVEIVEDFQESLEDELAEDQPFEDDSIQGFFAPNESVYCIDTSNNLVACGSGDDSAYLWEVGDGELKLKIDGFKDSVVCCKFSFDGNFCAFGALDGTVRVVQISSLSIPDHLMNLEGPSEVSSLIWHSKGNVLVVGSEDGTIWMWSIQTGQLMNVFGGHSARINNLSFGHDGKILCSIDDEGCFIGFNPKTAEPIVKYSAISDNRFLQGPLLSLCPAGESQLVFVGNASGAVQLIDALVNRILVTLSGIHESSIEAILYQDQLKIVITAGLDGKIVFWNVESAQVRSFKLLGTVGEPTGITCMKWIDKNRLATGSTDGIARVWDCRSGEMLQEFKGHQDIILDLVVGKEEKIITCSDDCTCLVF